MRACHSREHGQKTGQLHGKHAGQPRAWSRPVSGEGNLELPTMPFPGLCLCFPGALAAAAHPAPTLQPHLFSIPEA